MGYSVQKSANFSYLYGDSGVYPLQVSLSNAITNASLSISSSNSILVQSQITQCNHSYVLNSNSKLAFSSSTLVIIYVKTNTSISFSGSTNGGIQMRTNNYTNYYCFIILYSIYSILHMGVLSAHFSALLLHAFNSARKN